jgi:probable HAF family extracellular repeat protein
MLTTLAAPLLAALALAPPARLCAQQAYTLTDIAAYSGAPAGGSVNLLRPGINASGQVAGTTTDATGTKRAFRWTPSAANLPTGTLSLLPLPKGWVTSGAGPINRFGQVTGVVASSHGNDAALWQASGTVTTLVKAGIGMAINDDGQVAGNIFNGKGQYPFLWVNANTYNLQAQLPVPSVTGMNASGQIVGGWSNVTSHLWTPSTPNGTSGSSVQFPIEAWGINDSGQVVGDSANLHAVIYDSGTVLDLGTLPGFDASEALAINNTGQVVGGVWSTVTGETHLMLWDSVNGMRLLDDPTQFPLYNPDGTLAVGWALTDPFAINDRGQIVLEANNPAGQRRIVLLTPAGP